MKTLTGKEALKSRIMEWAATLDVPRHTITVRPVGTKWASCSTSGRLTFDEALIRMSPHLQDYVIVHEILHFRVPNHGKLWKSLMRAHLGEYELIEKELKKPMVEAPPRAPWTMRSPRSIGRLSVKPIKRKVIPLNKKAL